MSIYLDLLLAMNFYRSTMLLISIHARCLIQVELLRDVKIRLLDKYSSQISDFIRLLELKSKTNDSKGHKVINDMIHSIELCPYQLDDETTTRLQFVQFTLNETKLNVQEALKKPS